MKQFADLHFKLLAQVEEADQVNLLKQYFANVKKEELEWAIYFLSGRTLSRIISIKDLIQVTLTHVDFSEAIFVQCLDVTKDKLETISLVYPKAESYTEQSFDIFCQEIKKNKKSTPEVRDEYILASWASMSFDMRFIFNKLISNGYRSPISGQALIKAIALHFNQSFHLSAYNLYRSKWADYISIAELTMSEHEDFPAPYPMVESSLAVEEETRELKLTDYAVDYEWNGVRVQLVKGEENILLWTRRMEIINANFPELEQLRDQLPPETILDAVLIAHQNDQITSKAWVRKRINLKRVTSKTIEEIPVYLCVIDLLQLNGKDLRKKSYTWRKSQLEQLVSEIEHGHLLQIAEGLSLNSWDEISAKWSALKNFRSHAFILKKSDAPYDQGLSSWIKLSTPAQEVFGVLLYATRGEGSLANEYVEYTLGARQGSTFVPFAKVNPRLVEEDFLAMKKFVKENLIERFGPVYSVKAEVVFKISFEAVEESKRHKSGIKLKRPTFIAWNRAATVEDVVELEVLKRDLAVDF